MIHFHAANITPFLPVFQTFSAGWQLMTQKGGICQAMCPRQDFPPPGFILPISGNISLLLTGRKNDGIKRS